MSYERQQRLRRSVASPIRRRMSQLTAYSGDDRLKLVTMGLEWNKSS